MKGQDYLKRKLSAKRTGVLKRYRYYDQHERYQDLGSLISTTKAQQYNSVLGWCAHGVDFLADRLNFKGFDNDILGIMDIYNLNNPDIIFDSAILGALIGSCDFIYISQDENGDPRLQVIDGANATGIIDPITNMLLEGYAVLERDPDTDAVLIDAYFIPGDTAVNWYSAGSVTTTHYQNSADYPMLVPIIFRPDAKRPFGHSRISRSCMNLQDKARSAFARADITAEYYSFPQRYVLGLAQETEFDKSKASVSSFLDLRKDDDGQYPQVGQFPQNSMQPYMDQIKTYAQAFAGEMGMTVDDFGFSGNAPTSPDVVRSMHESLNKTAKKAQRTFGSGFLNAGYLARILADDYPYQRKVLAETIPTWEPAFDMSASQISGIGDAAIKLNQAVPGYITSANLNKMTGMENSEPQQNEV
jgi:hypothetical protein